MSAPVNCSFCGSPVQRFSTRGKPFKYCTGECDRAAMSDRMRGKKYAAKKVRLEVIADSDYGYENAIEKAEMFPHFGQRGQA